MNTPTANVVSLITFTAEAIPLITHLARTGIWFEFTPRPNGYCSITIKDEPGPHAIIKLQNTPIIRRQLHTRTFDNQSVS